jgi:histidinol phosphatase-like enzyme
VYRDYYQTKTESRFHNRLLSRLKENDITIDEILALEYVPREIITY